MASNWQCPYCNHFATLSSANLALADTDFDNGNKDGRLNCRAFITVCPNQGCREYTVEMTLTKWIKNGASSSLEKTPFFKWTIKPQSSAKPFPDYIPAPIRTDYEEACSILTLSPKASATLSRRCLQGMIRDYWGVSKDRLADEVKAIKDKIDPQTWAAIDAVRNIGNIGAHMEKDINTIVDVDSDEAALLSKLIETLIGEWYVRRHEREKQLAAIVAVASIKKDQQKARPAVSAVDQVDSTEYEASSMI